MRLRYHLCLDYPFSLYKDPVDLPPSYQASVEGKKEDLEYLIREVWPNLPFVVLNTDYTNKEPHGNWRMRRPRHDGTPRSGHDKFPEDSEWSHRILVFIRDHKQFAMTLKLYGAHEMSAEDRSFVPGY